MFDLSVTMSCHTLRYSSHLFGTINEYRIKYMRRSHPGLAILPSSILLQTEENSKERLGSSKVMARSDSASPLLSQANTVGIIGGASVDSTLNFVKKLIRWSSDDGTDDETVCPAFVLCSDPILNKQLLSHERSLFPSLGSKNEGLQLDHTSIVENLGSKRVFLERSGARCIVIPCHILHTWHGEVSKGCGVQFLHVGECVARELKEAKLKPVEAGSPLRIGVLGTNATLEAGFYQEKLQSEGFEVVVPDKATMEHTVIPAFEALDRKDMEGARNLLRISLQVLLVRAVNTIILASDDMRDLLPIDDPLLKKCVDPMDSLARSTIKWAQSIENGK